MSFFARLVLLLLLLWPVSGLGQDGETTEYESTGPGNEDQLDANVVAWHRRPVAIMFRSTVVPGWGQFANGKRLKSAVVFGTESYLIYRAIRAARRETDALDAARENPSQEAAWLANADAWNGEKRDYVWWTMFTVILSMGDAYVDAHLRGFDTEFEPSTGEARVQWSLTFD